MKRRMRRFKGLSTTFGMLFIPFCPAIEGTNGQSSTALPASVAQEPAEPTKKDAAAGVQTAKKDDESAVRLEEMKEIVHAFKFVTVDGTIRTPAELVADPLHRWTDPTRPLSGARSGSGSPRAARSRSWGLNCTQHGRSSSFHSRRDWSRLRTTGFDGGHKLAESNTTRSQAHLLPRMIRSRGCGR